MNKEKNSKGMKKVHFRRINRAIERRPAALNRSSITNPAMPHM
ncbi:hypothetical protein [Bacillus smithii]